MKNAAKRVGTLALAALLVVSMVGASGMAAAHDKGMDADDSDDKEHDGMKGGDGGDAVFTEEITVTFAGITITLGPPTDPNDDGVYEDVTGDGEVNLFDAVAHAGVVAAVNQGVVDLSDKQMDALDIDGDDDLDFQDSLALARMTVPGAMA